MQTSIKPKTKAADDSITSQYKQSTTQRDNLRCSLPAAALQRQVQHEIQTEGVVNCMI